MRNMIVLGFIIHIIIYVKIHNYEHLNKTTIDLKNKVIVFLKLVFISRFQSNKNFFIKVSTFLMLNFKKTNYL